MNEKVDKDGEDVKNEPALQGEMLVNCMDYEVETPKRTLPPSDSIAYVEKEKDKVEQTMFVLKESRHTKNLPEPKPDTLYVVSREVFNNEPERIDLVTPDKSSFNNGTIIVDTFEAHPDVLRSDEERSKWRRWPTCPHCGSTLQYKRWNSDMGYRDGARRIVQLHRNSRSGVNSCITMQIPDLRKEIDFLIKGNELIAKETTVSSEEDLRMCEEEM